MLTWLKNSVVGSSLLAVIAIIGISGASLTIAFQYQEIKALKLRRELDFQAAAQKAADIKREVEALNRHNQEVAIQKDIQYAQEKATVDARIAEYERRLRNDKGTTSKNSLPRTPASANICGETDRDTRLSSAITEYTDGVRSAVRDAELRALDEIVKPATSLGIEVKTWDDWWLKR